MDSATKGVVSMSLGCVLKAKEMPPTFMKAFSRSFAKFPDYSFIWQGEQHGSNVLHFDSIDQPSLLGKTKVPFHRNSKCNLQASAAAKSFIAAPPLCELRAINELSLPVQRLKFRFPHGKLVPVLKNERSLWS